MEVEQIYGIAIIMWLWVLCSWAVLQTFSEIYSVKWSKYNLLTKTLAFLTGPFLLTIVLFLKKNKKAQL